YPVDGARRVLVLAVLEVGEASLACFVTGRQRCELRSQTGNLVAHSDQLGIRRPMDGEVLEEDRDERPLVLTPIGPPHRGGYGCPVDRLRDTRNDVAHVEGLGVSHGVSRDTG